MKNRSNLVGSLMLIVAAAIWGTAFVAQSQAMDTMPPFTFSMARSLIGGIVLIPAIMLFDRVGKSKRCLLSRDGGKVRIGITREELVGGIACGVILFTAMNLQQVGIVYTTASKAGFLTALYIVLVPIAGIFMRRRPHFTVWIGVALALSGVYLLSVTEQLTIGKGDILVILCAFAFTAHILVVDHFSPKVDGVRLSSIQFLVAGVLSGIVAFIFEDVSLAAIGSAIIPILYVGIFSSGIAYTLQIVGQKRVNPAAASLIMSLESVFSVLGSMIILHERLTAREAVGCVLLFSAVIIAQIPSLKKDK